MKYVSRLFILVSLLIVASTGRAWACDWVFLPWDPSWCLFLVVILLGINYLLLYNKYHFVVEVAMVILTGLVLGGPQASFNLLRSLLLLLFFATVRLLRRHDFREIVTFKRPLLAASFFLVLMLWYGVAAMRPLLVTNCVASRQPLIDMATALEMYASDHGGTYPLEMKDTVPRYIREIPGVAQEMGEKDRAFYEKKYDLLLTLAYEVSSDRKEYTMTLRPWPHRAGEDGNYLYNSRVGLNK